MADRAPLPFLWGVLYAAPNEDGSAKSCRNCYAWVSTADRCILHRRNVKVTEEMVCGYHIPGEPLRDFGHIAGLEPLDPKLSGLEQVGEGTVCGTCRYFEQKSDSRGLCHGVSRASGQPPAPVDIMGCCARWEAMK